MTQQVTIPSSTEITLTVDMPSLNIVMDALQQRSNATQNLIAAFQAQINKQILPLIQKAEPGATPAPEDKEPSIKESQ